MLRRLRTCLNYQAILAGCQREGLALADMDEKSEINKRDIEFLYEMGCLRFIPRSWRQFLLPNTSNLAEHTLRVMWIAATIAKYEKVDTGKVIKMALVHDASESRAGDAHYVSRVYTKRDEGAAIRDTLQGTALSGEFFDLWEEYEKRESIEAKIVKDADNLDIDFEIQEQISMGANLNNWIEDNRKRFLYDSLYTETAKKIFEMLYASDPRDWHAKGKNRFTEGDYGK